MNTLDQTLMGIPIYLNVILIMGVNSMNKTLSKYEDMVLLFEQHIDCLSRARNNGNSADISKYKERLDTVEVCFFIIFGDSNIREILGYNQEYLKVLVENSSDFESFWNDSGL